MGMNSITSYNYNITTSIDVPLLGSMPTGEGDRGGGFLAQANLFGDPRQFTNDQTIEEINATSSSSSSSSNAAEGPTMTPSYSTSIMSGTSVYEPCPAGYICSRNEQQSCESVRQIPISLGIGDIHAGLYCPGRSDRLETGYEICDVGFYCPNSTMQIPCPKGYFCPHKTAKPEIKCSGCLEGATTLERPSYAYTVMVLVLVLMMLVVVIQLFRIQKLRRNEQCRALQHRTADGLRDVAYKRRHLKRLRRMTPKLKQVEKRLRKEFGSEVRMDLVISTETEDGKIIFKAEKLFDALDREKIGELSYAELNRLLKLSHAQLREFIRRMNEAAAEPPETEEVERHVFVTQFLPVFDAVSNLQSTSEEAAYIFDEIAKQGVTQEGEIPHRNFYTSLLADFLTDAQINALVKDFQRTKDLKGEELEADTDFLKAAGKQQNQKQKITPLVYRNSFFGLAKRGGTTSREDFVTRYPSILEEVTRNGDADPALFTSQLTLHKGIDVTFQDLSVSFKAKDRPVKILGKLSGRLRASSMTAVMGGPGAGKSSLIDALSGRLFNGTVAGTIKVNGHHTTLEEHANIVGFVPKEDCLYNELTVWENFLFSGMFQLAEGTPLVEIEDLADITMANLGLSRFMNKRHGSLSALERKRASIGMELMKKPRILFVDRPTRGLDANSTLWVVRSLKKLVHVQGITVCATIDQARRDTFELFDSLILLGSGGKLVYHGKTSKVGKYFNTLSYYLPSGDSVTDWMLDISMGRLQPPVKRSKTSKPKKQKQSQEFLPRSDADSKTTGTTADSSVEAPQVETKRVKRVTFAIAERTPSGSDENENVGCQKTKPFDTVSEQAKATGQLLNEYWLKHVKDLSTSKRARYEEPKPFLLPKMKEKPPFSNQIGCQLLRMSILLERNWLSRFIDTTVVCVGVVLITVMEGVAEPTKESDLAVDVNYDRVVETSYEAIIPEFSKLFSYALEGINNDIESYSLKVGVLFALMISVIATRSITKTRSQFYRESASGYNVAAFFWSQNIAATAVHSFQALLASLFAFCLRNTLSSWFSYVINFVMLSWLAVSWGLLFPLFVPIKYADKVTAIFVVFFALFFAGVISPITYEVIYGNVPAEVASGLLSSTRFFVEAMAVAEARSLPIQSGFTSLQGEAVEAGSFRMLHYGFNDFSEVNERSYNGWYWGVLPSLFVGLWIRWLALGLVYVSKQIEKPPSHKHSSTSRLWFTGYMLVSGGLLAASLVFMLRKES